MPLGHHLVVLHDREKHMIHVHNSNINNTMFHNLNLPKCDDVKFQRHL